jgi:hypothetical protein
MSTIGNSFPSLIDAYKGSAEGTVVEILKRQNPILLDAIATECNMASLHRHMIRTGLPSVAWGRLYQGTPQSKSTMQQVDDTTGFLEARSVIDTRLLDIAPDPAKARLVDSAPFLEAMSQELASGIFYHDTATTPEKFKGLSARYGAYGVNGQTGAIYGGGSATQVVDAGGRGNANTSIWMVTWGDHATSLIYPKGTKAGIETKDKGEEPVLDANGNTYYGKVTMFTQHVGMFVKDWRYNARICNIDYAAMMAGNVDLWALLRKAYYRLQSRRIDGVSSRIAIYANRDVMEILDAQSSDRALTAGNQNYTALKQANLEGEEVLTYRKLPLRETDAILNTEANVPQAA